MAAPAVPDDGLLHGEHVDSSINVHIVPRLGERKLNSVTPMVVERFLDKMESDGVGRGNQVNIFRVLKTILRTRTPREPWSTIR
ncbi:hypothetical protein GCM10010363_23500 [Streptomyces omiyaensis]|nr:hypothetical protein GCM10010363_23500 [Streptomyces omiyaensis]